MLLSVVVPCHDEQEALPIFYAELSRVAASMHEAAPELAFELVLVDDGSTDATLPLMRELAAGERACEQGAVEQGERAVEQGAGEQAAAAAEQPTAEQPTAATLAVRYLSFSRNFGKEAAIYAGLSHATGELVAIMDADLQDPPSLLPQMLALMERTGCDQVATLRANRAGEPPVRSWFAHRFYHLINRMSSADIVDGARDYRLMRRCVVEAILQMGEYNRFSKGIFGWVGFRTEWLPYENVERVAGHTKWSFWGLCKYAMEGIVAFSTAPLQVASLAGIVFCAVAIVAFLFVIVRALLFGDPVAGWPSLVSIMLFIGGMQMLCLGIMGQYLAKTYLETKRRPLYLIRESNLGERPAHPERPAE